MKKHRPVIGWREWLALPDLGVDAIKAKVDTGARTSSLHAYDIRAVRRRGVLFVKFVLHPIQRNARLTVEASAKVVDQRIVRSSAGHEQTRYVIETPVRYLGECWPIEITLTSRDAMGFRMLLGRQAIRGRFLVEPGRSFLGGKPPRKTRRPRS
jgi:hypothetical protein